MDSDSCSLCSDATEDCPAGVPLWVHRARVLHCGPSRIFDLTDATVMFDMASAHSLCFTIAEFLFFLRLRIAARDYLCTWFVAAFVCAPELSDELSRLSLQDPPSDSRVPPLVVPSAPMPPSDNSFQGTAETKLVDAVLVQEPKTAKARRNARKRAQKKLRSARAAGAVLDSAHAHTGGSAPSNCDSASMPSRSSSLGSPLADPIFDQLEAFEEYQSFKATNSLVHEDPGGGFCDGMT